MGGVVGEYRVKETGAEMDAKLLIYKETAKWLKVV